jgi:dTDP-4-dehydrorhamnose 3,5-epimerase-like enzyme
MIPRLITGGSHSDVRGALTFNNDFDALSIKRMYTNQNADDHSIRGWQGHKIEQRWFSAINGSFKIQILSIEYFENGKQNLKPFQFELKSDNMDILHIPAGFVSSIQSLEENSKLLILADYHTGEINDEFRFSMDLKHH